MLHLGGKISGALLALVLLTSSGCTTVGGWFGGDKEKVASGIPKKSEAAYYAEAQTRISKQQFDLAEESLSDLRTFYPVGDHAEDAQLDLMYVKYRQGDYPETVLAADRFIRLYPNSANADYAHYIRGVANMYSGFGGLLKYTNLKQAHRDTSFLRVAFESFKTLTRNYPNSRYAPDAAERMYYIYNQLAEHEMHIARFNIKRKAYVGALERARWVFQYYPQSVQTPEAIATLAYTHDKLGNTELANKYKTLLKLNYPSLLDGDKVNLRAARTDASWINKATLGVFGRPEASVKFEPVQVAGTRIQTLSRRGNLALPEDTATRANVPTQPQTSPLLLGSSSLSFGLGLPEGEPTNNPADTADNAAQQDAAQQEAEGVAEAEVESAE